MAMHEDARNRAGGKCAVRSCRHRAAADDLYCARCRKLIDYMVCDALKSLHTLNELTRNSGPKRPALTLNLQS
jgi:hypothetical protein